MQETKEQILPEAETKRSTRTKPVTRPKPQPPYAVILHNDPVNGFDFVIRAICKVFRYGSGKAFWLTLKAHVGGKAVVWTGMLEVAELKAEQLRGAGADPRMMHKGAKPLKVSIEAMPG